MGSAGAVEEGADGGGTLLGGVVESGEWPEDCLLEGAGGNGGMPLSDVESKLTEVEDDVEEEEEGAKRFGK